MKLFITAQEMPPLSGLVVPPDSLNTNLVHLTLASRKWDVLYIDVDECIDEGVLRFIPSKCDKIAVSCPDHPTLHQLHLLIELFPELDGKLRKAYMKGEGVHALLPEMWEHGETAGRESV